jgi:hypothetical protein
MSSVVNPLNLYGPYVPPTFEVMKPSGGGSGDVDEEKVNELIDDKIKNAVFV